MTNGGHYSNDYLAAVGVQGQDNVGFGLTQTITIPVGINSAQITVWARVTGTSPASITMDAYIDNQGFGNAELTLHGGEGWVQFQSGYQAITPGTHTLYFQVLDYGSPAGIQIGLDDFFLTGPMSLPACATSAGSPSSSVSSSVSSSKSSPAILSTSSSASSLVPPSTTLATSRAASSATPPSSLASSSSSVATTSSASPSASCVFNLIANSSFSSGSESPWVDNGRTEGYEVTFASAGGHSGPNYLALVPEKKTVLQTC